jgi:hypothetical protein
LAFGGERPRPPKLRRPEEADYQQLANFASQNQPVFAEKPGSNDKNMTLLQPLFRPLLPHLPETVAVASEK